MNLVHKYIGFNEGDTMVIKTNRETFTIQRYEQIISEARKSGIFDMEKKVYLLVIPDDIDIYKISPEEMRRAGWERIDKSC